MKHIIFENYETFSEDNIRLAKYTLIGNGIDNPSDDDINNLLAEMESDWYMTEKENLKSYDNGSTIIVIANLCLWNGRYVLVKGDKTSLACSLETGNDIEYFETFVDSNGDLRQRATHHDGTNSLLFRYWKDGVSEVQKDNFMEKCVSGNLKKWDISRYTRKAGLAIAECYGWKVRGIESVEK